MGEIGCGAPKVGRGEVGWLKTNTSPFWGWLRANGSQLTPSLQVAKLSFLGSEEEPEIIFDWVDVEQKGRLSLEEFSSGLSMSVLGGPVGPGCTARCLMQ